MLVLFNNGTPRTLARYLIDRYMQAQYDLQIEAARLADKIAAIAPRRAA
jgi:hypothetical protein